jgi:hypothetical protein
VTYYHGTTGRFDWFDPAHLGRNYNNHAGGFWLTTDLSVARAFAMKAHASAALSHPPHYWPDFDAVPNYRRRLRLAKRIVRKSLRYAQLPVGLPVVPGSHWDGASVLRVEIDGPVSVCEGRHHAPGITGGPGQSCDRAISEAQQAGAAAVHFPELLDGVGADLRVAPCAILLKPDAARIVERRPAMETLEDRDLREIKWAGAEQINFLVSETLLEAETHLPCDDGSPWNVAGGDLFTSCGLEWSKGTAVVTDREPTCEWCALQWRYRDDPVGLERAMSRYFGLDDPQLRDIAA